jgi:hypothetical protein
MDKLPDETVSNVCYYLDTSSLVHFSATCKRMRVICEVGKNILQRKRKFKSTPSPTFLMEFVSAILPSVFEYNMPDAFYDLGKEMLRYVTMEELNSNLKLIWFENYEFMRQIHPAKFMNIDEKLWYVRSQYVNVTYACMHDNPMVMLGAIQMRATSSTDFHLYVERLEFACESMIKFKARKCLISLCCHGSQFWNAKCYLAISRCLKDILCLDLPDDFERIAVVDPFSWIYDFGVYDLL